MTPIRIAGRYEGKDVEAFLDVSTPSSWPFYSFHVAIGIVSLFWLAAGEAQFGLVAVSIACFGWPVLVWRKYCKSREQYIVARLLSDDGIDVTIDDAGIAYQELNSRHEYKWSAFDNFVESDLLLSFQNRGQGLVHVPKRLIAPDDLLRLRGDLVRMMRTATPAAKVRAFEVLTDHGANDA